MRSAPVQDPGRKGLINVKALLFHCVYHVVLVTLYGISCFLSIVSSFQSLCVCSPLHLFWFSALFIFTISADFYNIWLVCPFKPKDRSSCVSVDLHLSKYEAWRCWKTEQGEEEHSKNQDTKGKCADEKQSEAGMPERAIISSDSWLYWYNTEIIYSYKH